MEERGVRWDSMETPSVAPSTPYYTIYSSSFDDFNDLVVVRAPALGAIMWGCLPAAGVLELFFACTMWPAPCLWCCAFLWKFLKYVSPVLKRTETDPFVDSCGRHRETIVPKAMGTPPDMAEPRTTSNVLKLACCGCNELGDSAVDQRTVLSADLAAAPVHRD